MHRAALIVIGLLLALAACTAADEPDPPARDSAGAASTEPTASVDGSTDPIRERCGLLLPSGLETSAIRLGEDVGADLVGAELGDTSQPGGTVLVLLHQTGTLGLCGWGAFAARAAEAGLPSVAFDLCDWAESTCPDELGRDPRAQVDLAVAHARDELGATRVVLVGASMGGAETVLAVGAGTPVDAWVDVSGPSAWDGVQLQSQAKAIAAKRVPGLVVQATSDGDSEYAAAQQLARTSGADFLDGGAGHGYELLTKRDGTLLPAGQAVLDLAAG